MKTALVLLLSFAAASWAQDPKPKEIKKLGSVTWNLQTHQLIWVVQKGTNVDGAFVPSSEDRYEILPDDAVMAFSNEKRAFTEDEATSLHHLLDVLSMYCAESVVWWDQGQGVPLDPSGKPAAPQKQPAQPGKPGDKPVKVQEPQPKSVPPVNRVSADDLVAILTAAH